MRDIPIPDDWSEEIDGWATGMFCFPNSIKWRAVILGAFQGLTYARLWERETGSIKDTQELANQIVESVDMSCNETFERMAVALESLNELAGQALEAVDQQYIDIVDLKAFLELAGLEKFAGIIDWLGEWAEIAALIPDVNLDLRLKRAEVIELAKGLFQMAGLRNDLQDIRAQLHAQAVATGGPSINTVVSAIEAAIPADDVIKVLLGNLDTSLTTVTNDVITGLLGNYMTNRTDDVRNAINGGSVLPGENVVNQLKRLKATLDQIEIAGGETGGVDPCGCITLGGEDEDETEDPPVLGEGDPPDGFEDWEEYSIEKCRYANKIVDEVIELFLRAAGISGGAIAGLAIAAVVALLASIITGGSFLFVLAGALGVGSVALIVYGALASMLIRNPQNLVDLIPLLQATAQETVCNLYTATSPGDAINIVYAWITDAADEVSDQDPAFSGSVVDVASNLSRNVAFNRLFSLEPALPETYVAPYDCDECANPEGCGFNLQFGSGVFRYDGIPCTISSEDVGGGVHSIFFGAFDTGCENSNWCVLLDPNPDLEDGLWMGGYLHRQWRANDNGVNGYHNISCDGASGYGGNFPDDQTYPCSGLEMNNNAAFTLTLRIYGPVGPSAGHPLTESTVCDA